ncbi:MAG: hypothetical protein K0R41_1493 [Geminicoccaceae bacterium]|nr:hypothetical protein [Geminicoccaceae bacterium]
MSRAAVGKAVRFHCTGSLGDGSGSGSSIERDPLRVKLGAGEDLTLELKLVEIRLGASNLARQPRSGGSAPCRGRRG